MFATPAYATSNCSLPHFSFAIDNSYVDFNATSLNIPYDFFTFIAYT